MCPNAWFPRRFWCARYWTKLGMATTFQAAWVPEDQVISRIKREPIS